MGIGIERRVPGRAARRAGRVRPRLYFPLPLSFAIFLLFLFLCQARKSSRRMGGHGITHICIVVGDGIRSWSRGVIIAALRKGSGRPYAARYR